MQRSIVRAPARAAGMAAVALALAVALLAPAAVLGHAALDTADPAPGSTIPESPPLITADFTERLDPALSSLVLAAPDGTIVATGGVAPGDPEATQMALRPPTLAPGRYDVRWTAVTPDDGAVEQGSYAFTIAIPTPSPVPTGAPTPAPTVTPSPASAAPSGTTGASPKATPAPTAGPEPGPGGPGNGLTPIVVAIVAGLVVAVVAGALYARRRRGSGGTA